MTAGTRANSITASAANTSGMGKALKMAFSGGSIVGLSVVVLVYLVTYWFNTSSIFSY